MDTEVLKKIGLSDNEIRIYLSLLKTGPSTAYEIGKKTGIYRVHVYDKLEQLMGKGLVTYVVQGAKKSFRATAPVKLKHYLEEKKKLLEIQQIMLGNLLPELELMAKAPREDTKVEVFKGIEGLKYILKDIIKARKEVMITGVNDFSHNEAMPVFMNQYFRDLKKNKIKERIITVKKNGIFTFNKIIAPTTVYKFLEEKQFNPTNTFVYAGKVVIVSWGTPLTAIMIQNQEIAKTYRNHFEYLWNVASDKI